MAPHDQSHAHALDLIWVLLGAFLVMFMQVGFALVETGFSRAKNALNTMAMNLVIYPLAVVGFWISGYALMFGGVADWPTLGPGLPGAHEAGIWLGGRFFGFFGTAGFALVSASEEPAVLAMFLFAVVFLDTAATIPTGAMAERWRFASFCAYGLFLSMLVYPLYGNWVWGGGWLSALGRSFGLGHGHVDFAGASVVHLTGGVASLAGTIVLGPRLGKFRRDGSILATPGHNLPYAVIGTLVLAFGWFGFNTASTLSATDPRLALIAVNTLLASASGALAALAWVWYFGHKPDVGMTCNGMLAGLVSITASCAFVPPPAALLIGGVSGALTAWGVVWIERRLRVDDPVGAISVHGLSGLWGTIALGLFADGTFGEGVNGVAGPVRGLLFGDGGQLAAQLVGACVNILFVFPSIYFFLQLTDRFIGNRVPPEVEWSGLDTLEMGSEAYPRS
jgi:Amt family ammonium transporter